MVVKKSSMLLLVFGLVLLHEGCSREDVGKQAIEADPATNRSSEIAGNCRTGLLYKIENAASLIVEPGFDYRTICSDIAALPDEAQRLECFRDFIGNAVKVRFEMLGDANANNVDERCQVRIRLGHVYGAVGRVAEEVFTHLFVTDGPQRDQWEPFFKFFAMMKVEERRVGGDVFQRRCGNYVEGIERFFSDSIRRGKVKPDELEWFKRRFKETVGRPPKLDPSPR